MTGVGWYNQQISLNFLNLVKFYICKPKSTGRGSLIKKQTICTLNPPPPGGTAILPEYTYGYYYQVIVQC
jgi:hypothetical protein